MSSLKKIDRGLIERYGKEAFMYVEYPHKRFWDRRPSDGDYRLELKKLLSNAPEHPMMLYVHIPFCHKQCLYCTCHVDITLDYSRVKNYLDYLYRQYGAIDAPCGGGVLDIRRDIVTSGPPR